MTETTTIAAISTAQAPGGIGLIRISGPQAQEIADKVFTAKSGKKLAGEKGYTVHYGRVHDEAGEIDEAIAINYRAPASFTGENVTELSCHGGLYLLRRTLRALYHAGARPAQPGEFTRRAFLNGKMGLTEAESVMELISARGDQAARAALAGRDGALERRIEAVKETLVGAAAHLEAWADYPEEEIPEVNEDELQRIFFDAGRELDRLLQSFDAGRALREGVDTVIAGKPNAGKSTLMNLLAGCERSIVTDVEGTTRDIVEETVLVGGIPLRLADTAGLRDTDDAVERIGVERARKRLESAQLVLAVFDSSRKMGEEDRRLAHACRNVPALAVVNKSDLPTKLDYSYIQKYFQHIVVLSAKNGDGLEELAKAIGKVLKTSEIDPNEGLLFTERQREAARRAKESLEEAERALQIGMTLDAVTVSLEGAVASLLELTGEKVTDAVVDEVFSRFCVGK
ncbi:tRNA uridine-5-carboxymethylaminomethyl(34) synthesis GTPase MnmE [Anaeromassilibacillus sp. An200]|uniref:tRNA uridine-5-carboxymethylaminomethyl(34) synthesis GTPase MnmE n=1 Tax=Anaeromassilibacillus sp. An200 TaxID=1965587 RepID=UPI000B399351|nr:tRNA uridine-5-carboxymethylaminomethyl(34) synthesis GTPase MnmE [Anaeromassilibacillus sp. An200]OUP07217.1 tRNA uridine-5-carboxymethylaminomethyl(34) synthesis GTPase MnmE [Anaeromassilibacillus sp. An200]